jgi:transposase-like protein
VVFLEMKEDATMGENGVWRHLPAEEKFEIVKEVITGKTPVSEVCKK